MSPLIRINLDPAQKIAELHGVGPKLADKIVEYRERNGPLRGPADLDNVEGISLNLAVTLSPHIDWSAPKHDTPTITRLSWKQFVLATVIALIIFGVQVLYAVNSIGRYNNYNHIPPGLVNARVWSIILDTIGMAGVSMVLFLYGLFEVTGTALRRQKVVKIQRFCVLLICTTFLLAAVVRLSHDDLITAEGRRILSLHLGDLIVSTMIFLTLVFSSPWLIKTFFPASLERPFVQRAYELIVLVLVLVGFLLSWLSRSPELPLLASLSLAALFIFIVVITLRSYRTGSSLLQIGAIIIGSAPKTMTELEDERWLKWLNAQLPDVGQQKALGRVLSKVHPPSKLKGVISIAIITIGGWLVLESLGAIIEWFIQNWLSDLTRPK